RFAAEPSLLDRDHSAVQNFGLLEIAASLDDRREIVQGDGDLRVLRAEGSLEIGQQSADDRLGLDRAAETIEDRGVCTSIQQEGRIPRIDRGRADLDRASREGFGLLESTPGVRQSTEVVEERG